VKSFVRLGGLFTLAILISSSAAHATYSDLFIFGDSLSDSGNNAIVLAPNVTPIPIPANGFIPDFPYASGHYTNGPIWAQNFASSLGLTANPSLLGGTDYAFGGARTGPLSPNPLPAGLFNPFPPSLETQAANFLLQHGNAAPSDALYVIAGGGNNVQDALAAIGACGGVPACIGGVILAATTSYATDIGTIVAELELAGAQRIIVWDTPDAGKTPALGGSATGTLLASSMNAKLFGALAGAPGVSLFDLFGLQDNVLANPAAFGLTNVTDACAANLAICDPSTFFFWDGFHPTSAVHAIIGNAMLALAVPEPATLMLVALGLAALGVSRRCSASRNCRSR
jgi:outer membrane lipase/esterase